jgi:hypothetical protein
MMTGLKKFFGRIGDALSQAPSYSRDTQNRHHEKEQMDQAQEEFIDSKSNNTNESRITEGENSAQP